MDCNYPDCLNCQLDDCVMEQQDIHNLLKRRRWAAADQIVEYDNPASDYVKQYENIPENGVLAQSDKNKK